MKNSVEPSRPGHFEARRPADRDTALARAAPGILGPAEAERENQPRKSAKCAETNLPSVQSVQSVAQKSGSRSLPAAPPRCLLRLFAAIRFRLGGFRQEIHPLSLTPPLQRGAGRAGNSGNRFQRFPASRRLVARASCPPPDIGHSHRLPSPSQSRRLAREWPDVARGNRGRPPGSQQNSSVHPGWGDRTARHAALKPPWPAPASAEFLSLRRTKASPLGPPLPMSRSVWSAAHPAALGPAFACISSWPTGAKTIPAIVGREKSRKNGMPHSRSEMLAAHERALKRFKRMTARDRFESLVKAGIYTRDGKLTPPYGG